MRDVLTSLARLCAVLSRLALIVAAIGMIAMTAIIASQVWSRYMLNSSLIWSEQASILIMGWFVFLGAAVGVREDFHMGFGMLHYVLPPGARPWLLTISDIAVLGFGVGMIWYGLQLAMQTWASTLPVVRLPGGSPYLPLAASGVLIVLFAVERLARRFAGMEPTTAPARHAVGDL